MSNLVKVSPNQRVDISDFDFLSTSMVDEERRFVRDVMTLDDVVLGSFDFTILSGTDMQINRGIAFGAGDGTGVKGQLISEGVASQTVSFSGLATATTYTVWIRFQYGDGEAGNRVFWDPTTTQEFVANTNTRQVATWSVVIGETSPGVDWLPLWTVVWNGDLAVDTVTDARKRMFAVDGDGDFVNGVYQPDAVNNYRSAWGSGTDRDDDRSTYGITNLRTFVQAMYKKLEEIQTGNNPNITDKNWWHDPPTSLDDVLPLTGATGNFSMRGSIFFDSDGAYDIGESLRRVATLNTTLIDMTERMAVGGGISPGIDINSGAEISVNSSGYIRVQSGGSLDIRAGALGSYQSANNFDWTGAGDLFFTNGGINMGFATTFIYNSSVSAKVDTMEPDTAAGSFLGQTANRYATVYASNVDVNNNLTINSGGNLTATSCTVNLQGTTADLDGSTLNWANVTTTGSIVAATAGSGFIGGLGSEYNAMRAYQIVGGDPSHVDSVNAAPLIGYASMNVSTSACIFIDVDPATTAGGVFEFSGFTAGTGVTTDPWTGGAGTTSGCVGKIRINSLPGINSGNPVWIRVFDGVL